MATVPAAEVARVAKAPPRESFPRRHRHADGPALIALTLLLFLAWTVHWHTFSHLELGLDGALSVDLARGPLAQMLAFNARDVHPPLFYAVLKGWLMLSGAHYMTAKYLAIAASMPALPLLYQLGRRLVPARAAVVAVFLLAVAPATLFLAPTVRDFGLGLTLSLATLPLTLGLTGGPSLPRRQRLLSLAALAALTAAALLTWYFHLFVLAAEALALLVTRRRLIGGYVALLAGAVLALPWYLYVLPHITRKLAGGITTFGSAPHLPSLPKLLTGFTLAVLGQSLSLGAAIAAIGWLLALLVGLLARAQPAPDIDASPAPPARRNLAAVTFRVALLIGVVEVALTTLRWSDIGSLSRYVLPLLPFAALFQIRALLVEWRVIRLIAGVGLIVAVPAQLLWFHGLVTSPPIDWSHDPALSYVAAHARPGDAILFNDRARRARYLLDGGPLRTAVIHTAGQAYLADSAGEAEATAAALAGQAGRIWLVQISPAVNVAQVALATHAYGLPATNVGGSDVQLFLSPPSLPSRPVGLTFGGVITLQSAAVPGAAAPGTAIPLDLAWVDVQPTAVSYTVFVHVDSTTGKTVAQHDGPPQLGFSRTSTWQPGQTVDDRFAIQLPANLPAGDYALHAGLYVGSQRLNLPDGVNQVTLGTVHVGP